MTPRLTLDGRDFILGLPGGASHAMSLFEAYALRDRLNNLLPEAVARYRMYHENAIESHRQHLKAIDEQTSAEGAA